VPLSHEKAKALETIRTSLDKIVSYRLACVNSDPTESLTSMKKSGSSEPVSARWRSSGIRSQVVWWKTDPVPPGRPQGADYMFYMFNVYTFNIYTLNMDMSDI
jgi:hypothetical protein